MVVDLEYEQEVYTSSENNKVGVNINPSGSLLGNMSFHGKERSQHWDITIPSINLVDEITQSKNISAVKTESEFDTLIDKVFSTELNKSIIIHVTEKSDYCLFDCEELEIYEAGEDYHDAMMNFCQFFISDLEHWKSVKDEKLTKDALILKGKYLSYI